MLLTDELLGIKKDLGGKLHISRLVYSVHVTKGRGHAKTVAYRRKDFVRLVDFFGLGIEFGRINIGIVHTIFLATGYSKLNLDRHSDFVHPLEVVSACPEIIVNRLLGEIQHMRTVKRLPLEFIKLFSSLKHSVHPRQKLTGSMICM